eukprot:m.497691 g.497691  ORF g.497691 m.497691 type:complete len:172 (+) comp21817_c0_seq6:432-947(+)
MCSCSNSLALPSKRHMILVLSLCFSGGNFTTLPQHFKEQGYLSLGVGKIFHPGGPSNNSDVAYSWSPECLQKGPHGHITYNNIWKDPDGGTYTSPAVHPFNNTDDEMGEGKLALNASALIDLIVHKRGSGDKRPFFLATGFHKPHIPWKAPQKYCTTHRHVGSSILKSLMG